MKEEYSSRTLRLVGRDAMDRLKDTNVIIFGVGGVGSWAAESLIRTGIGRLTIVDPDRVAPSNINRQLPATTHTIGMSKVEVLKDRLLSLNPDARIIARSETYNEESADQFDLSSFDYVIDAIDSLKDKALLIYNATRSRARFYSSMGAALKMDPTRVEVAEFYNVKGCPLARALRQRFKRTGRYPGRKFKCVYSDELLSNLGDIDPDAPAGAFDAAKKQINGSLMHITAIFGLTLAGLVIQDITSRQ